MGTAPMLFPWRWFGRPSRSSLERELAVAQVRAQLAEVENATLRARLIETEREYARFRDQALARLGAITAPVTDHSTPAVPASPLAGVLNALSVTAFESKPTAARLPEPAVSMS